MGRSSHRTTVRGTGLLAVGAALACAISVWTASASAGSAGLGPMPPPDQSRCAEMTFSPHIANVGDLIQASAGPITSQCRGSATSVRYGWPVPDPATGNLPGLVQAHRCPVDALHCEYRAVMFTAVGMWNGLCITGTSPDGGWSSCEAYVVRVGRYLRLTGPISGLNGKTVVVHLSGAGVRETTTTDSDAFWQFAVRQGRISCHSSGAERRSGAP